MPLTLLHTADLHLDRAFVDRGLRTTARRRRQALGDAFQRILALARDADALLVAGDLYEHEHVTGDTQNMLVAAFGELGRPVLLLPGNHDPHVPGSLYERAPWPANVHVFRRPEPEPYELGEDVVVWGIAHAGRELRPEVVRRFRAPRDGRTHLLLLHATLLGALGQSDQCPVTAGELAATGVHFALLGHHHAGRIVGNACYPGSPEPLTWGERGVHAVNVLRVDGPQVQAELRPVNRLSFEELRLDVAGADSASAVEERARAALAPRRDENRALRLVLCGELAPACPVRVGELEERLCEGFADLLVVDSTTPAFDLARIAQEPTVRGRFVAKLLERREREPEEAARLLAAAHAGLRAFEGRSELVDVG
jgi:DNA repair protein SbcD/Mre11